MALISDEVHGWIDTALMAWAAIICTIPIVQNWWRSRSPSSDDGQNPDDSSPRARYQASEWHRNRIQDTLAAEQGGLQRGNDNAADVQRFGIFSPRAWSAALTHWVKRWFETTLDAEEKDPRLEDTAGVESQGDDQVRDEHREEPAGYGASSLFYRLPEPGLGDPITFNPWTEDHH